MKTLIVDNYDSFTYNIFQMIGAINGEAPLVFANDRLSWEQLLDLDVDNVIISPGVGRPEHESDFGICRRIILEYDRPLLGVCLGLQGLAHAFGARIVHAPEPMHGRLSRIEHNGEKLFAGIPSPFQVVRYHSLCVNRPLPDCLRMTAWTEDGILMAAEHRERPIWGVQFHPESICTEHGATLLRNFQQMSCRPNSSFPARPTFQATKVVPSPEVAPLAGKRPEQSWKIYSRKLPSLALPEDVFVAIYQHHESAFWLDTNHLEHSESRFSYMGSSRGERGKVIYYTTGEECVTVRAEGAAGLGVDTSFFTFVKQELAERSVLSPELPFNFNGGVVGYFGYELKTSYSPDLRHKSTEPDSYLIMPDRMLVFDHREDVTYLVYLGLATDSAKAETWFSDLEGKLPSVTPAHPPARYENENVLFSLEQSREMYLDNIQRCQEYLRDGESYEICLTNRLVAFSEVQPLDFYRTLRKTNPAPYSAFLQFPGAAVACSSPERLLRILPGGEVESKPIKGTQRRGDTANEDRLLAEELQGDPKSRCENLMIVDLVRNDLGRVCRLGSVSVPKLMAVETYATVHQLVSTIRGQLAEGISAVDCLECVFPGGSMTGAAKIRTMMIIDRLESSARGIYSGSMGFIGLGGAADLSVVIRTAVFCAGRISIGVGGAIVAKSDPEQEFQETMLKAKAMMRAFQLITAGAEIKQESIFVAEEMPEGVMVTTTANQ